MTHTCQLEHDDEPCGDQFDTAGGLSQHLLKSRKDDAHRQIETRRETYRLVEQWDGEELDDDQEPQGDDGGMLMPEDDGGDEELPSCGECGEPLADPEELEKLGRFKCDNCGNRMRWT